MPVLATLHACNHVHNGARSQFLYSLNLVVAVCGFLATTKPCISAPAVGPLLLPWPRPCFFRSCLCLFSPCCLGSEALLGASWPAPCCLAWPCAFLGAVALCFLYEQALGAPGSWLAHKFCWLLLAVALTFAFLPRQPSWQLPQNLFPWIPLFFGEHLFAEFCWIASHESSYLPSSLRRVAHSALTLCYFVIRGARFHSKPLRGSPIPAQLPQLFPFLSSPVFCYRFVFRGLLRRVASGSGRTGNREI